MTTMTLDEYIDQEREHCIAKMRHGTYDEFMYWSGRHDTLEDIERHVQGRRPDKHCVCGCHYDAHRLYLMTTQRTAKSFTNLACTDCGCNGYLEDDYSGVS